MKWDVWESEKAFLHAESIKKWLSCIFRRSPSSLIHSAKIASMRLSFQQPQEFLWMHWNIGSQQQFWSVSTKFHSFYVTVFRTSPYSPNFWHLFNSKILLVFDKTFGDISLPTSYFFAVVLQWKYAFVWKYLAVSPKTSKDYYNFYLTWKGFENNPLIFRTVKDRWLSATLNAEPQTAGVSVASDQKNVWLEQMSSLLGTNSKHTFCFWISFLLH